MEKNSDITNSHSGELLANILCQSLGPLLFRGSSVPALSLLSLVFIGLDRMSGGWRKIYREHC